MRRGYNNCWLVDDANGTFMGVNLGADFVAEHEWGINDIKHYLGVSYSDESTGIYGLERRRCEHPETDSIIFKKEGNTLNLVVTSPVSVKYHDGSFDRYVSFQKGENLATAWSGGGFIIRVKGEENIKRLEKLYEELLKGNVAVWVGGGGLFENGGLCLVIISAVPPNKSKVMYDADVDREKLKEAAEATGIRHKISEADEQWRKMREVETGARCYENKWGFFSLSPSWNNGGLKKATKHPVIFWLNPRNQDKNNYGWFSVEELEQWLEDKGPVIKH